MTTIEDYLKHSRTGLQKAIMNARKVRSLCELQKYQLTPNDLKEVVEFQHATTEGLEKIISGNLDLIENLYELSSALKHDLNIEELLKVR